LGHISGNIFYIVAIFGNGVSVDKTLPRGGGEYSAQDFNGGRFSRAVGSQEPENLSFIYIEADIVDGVEIAEFPGKISNPYRHIPGGGIIFQSKSPG